MRKGTLCELGVERERERLKTEKYVPWQSNHAKIVPRQRRDSKIGEMGAAAELQAERLVRQRKQAKSRHGREAMAGRGAKARQ
jgi:hypothetical protein